MNSFNSAFNSEIPGIIAFNLSDSIDLNHKDSEQSSIDKFISNATEINKLITPTISIVLGNLIILGYVSALESYFRSIFKNLILIDDFCKTACEKRKISYGSVVSLDSSSWPEALFEDISIAGKQNIISSINNFLNINMQDSSLPADLKTTFDQFEEICQLRHCIIHRFGIFGSNNAINLGLSRMQPHIEKPIACSFPVLQKMISICHNTVRITNNYLAEKVLVRLIKNGNNKNIDPIWTWSFEIDKILFSKYYHIFYSKLSPPTPKQNIRIVYMKYKKYYNSI